MVVGVLRLELQLYSPQSLKEKRSIVRKIVARCRNHFPVSAAETGMHDLWQRAEIGISMVAGSEADAQSVFDRLESDLLGTALAEITLQDTEFLHY